MTVKDKSIEYANNKVTEKDTHAYDLVDRKNLYLFTGYDIEDSFEKGAKYVISEVEKILDNKKIENKNYVFTYTDIRELIYKLKG